MEKIYYDPSNPGSFSSVKNLASSANVPIKTAKDWLISQDTYTLHKLPRKKFPRNKYYVDNIDELWQADLCDLSNLSKYNDNYKYILTVIDVFSKFSWVIPLKTKHNSSIRDAFESILAGGRKPYNLQTDKGKEFIGKPIQKYFNSEKINYYTTRNDDTKAAVIERYNRTLKNRLSRYLTSKNSLRYIDVLYDVVESYNNSYHSSIKMRPVDVTDKNVLKVWKNLYNHIDVVPMKPKLTVNSFVRIAKKKYKFEKAYEINFTEEIFKIVRVVKRPIPVYEVVDLKGELIDGLFYDYELQPVTLEKDKTFKIDKIEGRRVNKGIREVLVSWRGYPAKFNSWIPAKDLVNLQNG